MPEACERNKDNEKQFEESKRILETRKKEKLIYEEEKEDFILVKDFFSWCKKFLKFSVDGSAYGIKIDSRDISNLPDELYDPRDEVSEKELAEEKKKFEFIKDIQEDPNKKSEVSAESDLEYNDHQIKINDNILLDENEAEKLKEEREEEKKELAYLKEKVEDLKAETTAYNENPNSKQKSMSKTAAFALGGKSLARIFFWTGGPVFTPEFTLHLKKETKKIRNVANSDLASFVKILS